MNGNRITDTFTTLRSRLKGVASAILRNEDDAEDALQDAFCRLWKRHDESKMENIEANARLAVKHVCLDMLRKRSVRATSSLSDDNLLADKEESQSLWEATEMESFTRSLLSKLPERQREVFRLASEGIDNDIIAMRLGMTEEAVRQNICRARKALRNEYGKMI